MSHVRIMAVASAAISLLAFSPVTPTAAQTPSPTPVTIAACPTGVTLTIAPPAASAPTTVNVTLSPALNIKAATVGDPASFHLHYFIDTPATAAGTVIPSGDAKIIHAGVLTQDLGALAAGSHTVTAVLGQLTHVACETRASVTFTTVAAAQASPAAPKTGNAGLLGESNTLAAGLLLVAAVAVTIGGRAIATRRA